MMPIMMSQSFWLVLAMIAWGLNWISAKVIVDAIPANVIVFYRFSLTAILFIPLIKFKRLSLKIPFNMLGWVVITSVIMGLYQAFFFMGLTTGLAGEGGVFVTTLNPIITFLVMTFIDKKPLKKLEIGGLILGLFSMVFFLQLWHFNVAHFLSSGSLAFIGAAVTWSALTITSQKIKLHPIVVTFYTFALMAPFSIIGHTQYIYTSVSFGPVFWMNIVYLALFGTIFSTTIYLSSAAKLGPKKASSYIFVVPVSAALFAFFILNEPLGWASIVGGVLALSGVTLLNRR